MLNDPGAGLTKLDAIALAEDKDGARDDDQGRGLDDGQNVLEVGTRPDPDIIDRAQKDDEEDRNDLDREGRHLEEIRKIPGREGDGQRGDSPRVDDQEKGPAEEE